MFMAGITRAAEFIVWLYEPNGQSSFTLLRLWVLFIYKGCFLMIYLVLVGDEFRLKTKVMINEKSSVKFECFNVCLFVFIMAELAFCFVFFYFSMLLW